MTKAKKILTGFTEILKSPEMQILPGQIAFYLLMSIVPIAAIIAIVASYITSSFNFLDTIGTVLPPVFANILASLANNMQFEGVAIVLILYLLLGSNAPASIITASNLLYEIEQPNYFRLKIKSFFMTIMIVILLLFVVLIPLFGDTIVRFLIEIFDSSFLYSYKLPYIILKGLGSFVIMYFIIKLLYTLAPNKKIKSTTTTKGALFTSVGWIVATYIFAFYITKIASYDVIYGNFANILILLLWLYILAYLFVVGMALNVENFHKQGKCIYDKKEEKKASNKKETKQEKGKSKKVFNRKV
ncbi:MAG: YihY/virulence factor BrkB family protein [Bacilli bacterium]